MEEEEGEGLYLVDLSPLSCLLFGESFIYSGHDFVEVLAVECQEKAMD